MIEIVIPWRLYHPYHFDDIGREHDLNLEMMDWIEHSCKGKVTFEDRIRKFNKGDPHPWHKDRIMKGTERISELFATFENAEDATLFKLFWL